MGVLLVCFDFAMAHGILDSLLDFIGCVPCGGVFGRWKTKLQDDDADLWMDLGFVNHVPDRKPPPIPKVVSIVQDDDEEDVSTIYGTAYHGPRLTLEEIAAMPQSTGHNLQGEKKEDDYYCAMLQQELELEPACWNERATSRGYRSAGSYTDLIDDASLESIMGPRSCRSAASSRPPPASLLEQQREQYLRFVDSFSYSFHKTSEDQKESYEGDDDCSSYSGVRRKLTMYLKRKEEMAVVPATTTKPVGLLPLLPSNARYQSQSTRIRSTLKMKNRFPDISCRTISIIKHQLPTMLSAEV